VTLFPPLTVLGNDRLVTGGGVTVKGALFAEAPEVAVMVTVAVVHCGMLVTGTGSVWLPAGTVTTAGTVATEVLLLLKFTGQPPDGAAKAKTIVAISFEPPGPLGG
jgi:hypothetical protein